jgi:hypothetical protein
MRRVAIAGGGQAGLVLALGLLDKGYRVTLVSNRTPEAIQAGFVMSSQCMFGEALRIERELRLNLWDGQCPPVEGISLTVPHPELPGATLIDWSARLATPASSVDQRLKMPALMALFEQRGGKLVIADVGISELEHLAQEDELVIVAAGKGELVRHFAPDPLRSPIDKPMRALAMCYVTGIAPRADYSRVAFNLIPGVGEYFTFPALSPAGPCDILLIEAVPGGPFDRFQDPCTPQEHLAKTLALLQAFLPWEAERARHAQLTDVRGVLAGRVTPGVRKPVMTLPSGKLIFGMGDAVCVNDPITGQGSNSATKAAKVYLDAIVAHGEDDFTRTWMEQTFERFWDYGQHVANWTNSLLGPPPLHILALLDAAGESASLASAIVNGFDHPPGFFPWWADPSACNEFVARQRSLDALAA